MRNSLKAIFTAVTILVVTTFLIACGSPAANNTNTAANNASPTNASTPANSSTPAATNTNADSNADADKKDDADAAPGDSASADKIGVAECDDYIAKYEACLSKNVPAAQRAAFEGSLKTMRDSWTKAAATEAGKSALATGCKTALDAAKASMSSFNCEW